MHSKYFNIIKKFYDDGIYTKENVASFVDNGKKTSITTEEYEEITGNVYISI